MDGKLIESFLNLGAAGLLGLVFLVVFRGIQKQVDRILEAHNEERCDWQESSKDMHANARSAIKDNTNALHAVEKAVSHFSNILDDVDCAKYKHNQKFRH